MMRNDDQKGRAIPFLQGINRSIWVLQMPLVSELSLDSHIWLLVSKWNLQVAIFHWQKFTEKIWEFHPKYSWKSRLTKFPRCFITFPVWLAFICLTSHSHEIHIYLCKKYFSRIWNNFFLLKFFSLSSHPSRQMLVKFSIILHWWAFGSKEQISTQYIIPHQMKLNCKTAFM